MPNEQLFILAVSFLHTPLTITEQHTHGIDLHLNMPGIPQGIDAAVAEGWPDLKVKNNTAHTFQFLVAVDSHNMSGTVLSDTRLRPSVKNKLVKSPHYIRIFLGNKQLHIKVPSAAVQ